MRLEEAEIKILSTEIPSSRKTTKIQLIDFNLFLPLPQSNASEVFIVRFEIALSSLWQNPSGALDSQAIPEINLPACH